MIIKFKSDTRLRVYSYTGRVSEKRGFFGNVTFTIPDVDVPAGVNPGRVDAVTTNKDLGLQIESLLGKHVYAVFSINTDSFGTKTRLDSVIKFPESSSSKKVPGQAL